MWKVRQDFKGQAPTCSHSIVKHKSIYLRIVRPYKQKKFLLSTWCKRDQKGGKNITGKKFLTLVTSSMHISTFSIINCPGCCSYYWSILILRGTGDDNTESWWPCLSICYSWLGIFQWNSCSLESVNSQVSLFFLEIYIFTWFLLGQCFGIWCRLPKANTHGFSLRILGK